MSAHSHETQSPQSGGFWSIFNIFFGAFLALVAGFLAINLVMGGIAASKKIHNPEPVVEASPDAAAPAPAPAATPQPPIELTLKPDPSNPMAYATKEFTVKAGQLVKLTFDNQSPVPLPHNVVIGKIDSKGALVAGAMKIMVDAKGLEKGYIPEDPSVLAHTKLVQPGQKETIEFTLPSPGAYPYICTFPGHYAMMFGTITAE
jgi:azurin